MACNQRELFHKIPVYCPDVIKMYNQGIGGVKLVD